jgi:vancomycin resistance protein YoaR
MKKMVKVIKLMMKKSKMMVLAALAVAAFGAGLLAQEVSAEETADTTVTETTESAAGTSSIETIMPNVYINGVAVGGMSRIQATTNVKSSVDKYAATVVKFTVGDDSVETTMGKLGCTTDVNDILDEAMEAGRTGNCLKRYKDATELGAGIQKIELSTSPNFDSGDTSKAESVLSELNRDSVNASIEMNDDSTFNIIKGQTGIEVDVDATVKLLAEKLDENWGSEIDIDAVYEETQPEADENDLSQMTDELGTFTTSYSGAAGRMQNVENAAAFLNGSLILPGEEFDVNAALEPYTEENGYAYAAEYSSGKVVQGLGGGICQVSTTLYNALLYAELEIVERYPHSMTVGYVDLSRDAAIAGDVKNLVFKNNYDYPIYIAGGCSNGQLTFSIFGKETRPSNRTIEYESKTISTIQPGDAVVTEDDSLAPGEQTVTQNAHTGYTAELWKNIYVDGELQESVQVNSSTYNASPQYISVGPGSALATTEPSTEN